jgi:hypothetical protein
MAILMGLPHKTEGFGVNMFSYFSVCGDFTDEHPDHQRMRQQRRWGFN